MTFRVFQIFEIEAPSRYQAIEIFRKMPSEDRQKHLVDQFAANPKPQGWVSGFWRQIKGS